MDGMNVSTMSKRLEAAASRLEDVVMFAEMRRSAANPDASGASNNSNPPGGTAAPGAGGLHDQPSRTNSYADNGQSDSISNSSSHAISPKSSTPLVVVNAPPSPEISQAHEDGGYAALKSVASRRVEEFVRLSAGIAPGVEAQAKMFAAAFEKMSQVVALAKTSAKPEMAEFVEVLKPMNEAAARVESIRDEFRGERDLTNFFATVPAGVGASGWVTIEGKQQASGFITEMKDSAQFYGNRVLKDRKDAKPWVDAYIGISSELASVVKQRYPEGSQWNTQGGSASSKTSAGASADAPSSSSTSSSNAPGGAGGPPPPPPPPPSVEQLTADVSTASTSSSSPAAGGMGGVFAELSKGEGIASGSKPVDKAALKASKPPIPKSTKPKPGKPGAESAASKPAAVGGAKLNPRVELVESKWHIEDLEDKHDVEIAASMGQSVQIDNCKNCTIKITGKAATFNLSRSDRVGSSVETMVASCDIVNCTNFGLQITGTSPSLMIDQSAQGSIYLSKESSGIDIFTSQTTAINVNVPEDEPGAYREIPSGEQIVHNLVNGQFKSTVVKHS